MISLIAHTKVRGVGTQNRAIFRTSALTYIAMRMARVSLVFVPTGNAGSTHTNTPCNRQSACWCCTTGGGCWPSCMRRQHCGQALTITTDEVTLGCAGLPRHPQPQTQLAPYLMWAFLHYAFQSVCLICRTEGVGGDKRVGRETRTPPAPENTRHEREGRVLLLPLQHLHCDHSWTRAHDAAAAPLHVCTRVNQTICM